MFLSRSLWTVINKTIVSTSFFRVANEYRVLSVRTLYFGREVASRSRQRRASVNSSSLNHIFDKIASRRTERTQYQI